MARIKAEVREHAQQQRLLRHKQPPPTPSSSEPVAVKTEMVEASPPTHEPSDPPAGGCIDLTADDETEDEEDADEPFAAATTHQPTREDEQHERLEPPREAPRPEPEQREDESDDAMELETDDETEAATAPAGSGVSSVTTGPLDDGEPTDESEVDEEMPRPVPRPVEEPASRGLGKVARVVVDKISHVLSAVMASASQDGNTSETAGVDDNEMDSDMHITTVVGLRRHDDANDEEEEQDERWPDLPPQPEKDTDSIDDGTVSSASDAGDGSGERVTVPSYRVVRLGDSLEDGEIFEEGAVAKSPTAVKEAIALELQAARDAAATKKKQKRRGRKKNKRKADAMMATPQPDQEELDEFGRNLRHQPMPRTVTLLQTQDSSPSLAMNTLSSAPTLSIVSAPSMLPPHPPPPMPHQLPLPPHAYMTPPPPHYVDDQIVRVNRHGGFEPFAFQGNRMQRPAVAPVFSQPPPPPMGGFRYVPVEQFAREMSNSASSPSRGIKRPYSQTHHAPNAPSTADDGDAFDLDSLRAAALKTKRKTLSKDDTAIPTEPTEPVTTASSKDPPEGGNTVETTQQEEDPSLDALRMELLKSMRRKRRESSSQSAASLKDSVDKTELRKDSENNQDNQDDSPSKESAGDSLNRSTKTNQETAAAAGPVSSFLIPKQTPVVTNLKSVVPPVIESPQFRPLTAMNQSIVIRLSLDDLMMEHTESRSDSFEVAAARFDKVVDEVRAEAASTEPTSAVEHSKVPEALEKEQPRVSKAPTNVSIAQSGPDIASTIEKTGKTLTSTSCAQVATIEAAEPAKRSVVVEQREKSLGRDVEEAQVTSKTADIVAAELVADPAKLETERKACLASIREADTHIARLDAEIAALRLAIAAKEAESSNGSAAVTACGA